MSWKKMLAAALAMLLSVLMISCSEPAQQESETQDAEVDTSPVKVKYETDFDAMATSVLDLLTENPAEDFDRVTQNGAITITGYHGEASAVRVPDEIGGVPVTAVADRAFADNKALKTLVLPESITHVGASILSGCTALTHLQTPLLGADSTQGQSLGYLFGVSDYENHARDIPATLILLRVGEGVERLSDYALYDCNDLQCVILPESLRAIGKFAFYNCTSMVRITGLEGVRVIGEYAFADCAKLRELTLGAAVDTVGFSAFRGCLSLTDLTLPFAGGARDENTYLGYVFGSEYPDFAKGHYPPSLARVTILEGCTVLGDYAFFECDTLKEIVLPNGLKSIGVRAFYGCTALWSVALPNSLETIRENAFYGCDSLLAVTFGTNLQSIGINAFYRCDSLKEVVLPASLSALPASCFADCIALESVDLGGVHAVGARAFHGCKALKNVKTSKDVSVENGNEYLSDLLKS